VGSIHGHDLISTYAYSAQKRALVLCCCRHSLLLLLLWEWMMMGQWRKQGVEKMGRRRRNGRSQWG